MASTRPILALALILFVSACSTAGPSPTSAPAPVTLEPDEEVEEGSAALEEAGLSGDEAAADASGTSGDSSALDLDLEEPAAAGPPAAFLYPSSGTLPEGIQREVEAFVEKLTAGNARANLERWLEREAVWGDWVRAELRAAELPEELVYLAMIESGFHPTIVSHAGATGMWQFMAPTARRSGLRVDSWVDERRDPVKATRAAIRHLAELYEATGDWALSAAAYNAGLGRVSRAQARQPEGARDYFSLSAADALPRETRNYVPIMLAAAWVDAHRSRFDLPPRQATAPARADSVPVDGRVRLSLVARALDLPDDTLKALNAHYVRGAVPPEGGSVRVPVDTDTAGLGAALAAVPRDQRLLPDWNETRYAVRSGDSWWRIARRHDTTVDRLRRLNPRRGDVIHPGDRLVVRRVASYDIPGKVAVSGARPPSAETKSDGPAGKPVARSGPAPKASGPRDGGTPEPAATPSSSGGDYVVRAGDTMTGIARRLGIALDDLARWNGMESPRPVRTGETLRTSPPVVRYTVRPGDTMTGIARRFGVALDDLVEWNGMNRPRPLKVGETLEVRRP
jgi:membrane-bound lytic murein transglycosylase D